MTKYGMATEKQTSSISEVTSSSSSPASSNLGGTDSVSFQITGHKLNGNNYLQWSQSVLMYICGKGKDDYLTGEVVPPKAEDPKYKTWKIENNMVMSWLVNSMTNEIGENFLLYGTAQEIWEAAREFYSAKKIPLRFSRSKLIFKTFDKEILQSPNTIIFLPVIGSDWMYLKTINGAVQGTLSNSEKLLRRKEFSNS